MCANSKLSQQRGSPHSSVVAVGRPPDPGNSFEVEDAASHSSTGRRGVGPFISSFSSSAAALAFFASTKKVVRWQPALP